MTSLNRQCRPSRRGGFTLLEMVVVIAIIILLVTLLVPTVRGALEYTRAAICGNNLHELAEMLRLNTGPGSQQHLPFPGEWATFVTDRNGGGLLRCPVDDREPVIGDRPDLSHIYVVQRQGGSTRFSNVQTILDTGQSSEDGQVHVSQSAHGVTAGPEQILIRIGSECALIRLTYGLTVRFESLIIPQTHSGHRSTHWLCIDNDEPGWRSEVQSTLDSGSRDPSIFVMRFQGYDYATKWPDYELESDELASYAMSNAVNIRDPRPGQLMLVEYRKSVAKVYRQGYGCDALGDDNDDEYGCLRTRHSGRANVAMTGGDVKLMTREELQAEYDMYTVDRPIGLWAPKGKAGQPP